MMACFLKRKKDGCLQLHPVQYLLSWILVVWFNVKQSLFFWMEVWNSMMRWSNSDCCVSIHCLYALFFFFRSFTAMENSVQQNLRRKIKGRIHIFQVTDSPWMLHDGSWSCRILKYMDELLVFCTLKCWFLLLLGMNSMCIHYVPCSLQSSYGNPSALGV